MAVCSMQGSELELTGSMTDVRPAQFKWCSRYVCAFGGLLILSATIGSCSGAAAPEPGPSFNNNTSNKIVGGTDAREEQWPFVVSVQNKTDGEHFCGGSLINNRWVLSAAHCYDDMRPEDLSLVFGKLKLMTGPPGVTRDVARIVRHPRYHYPDNDVALLQLTSPVTFNNKIKRVCLAATGSVFSHGTPSWVLGWGHIQEGVPLPPPMCLQQVQVPVIDNPRCRGYYPGEITDNMICAGLDKGGKDACHLDSGGPMVSRKDILSDWVQSGVVSWGEGCARPKWPGVYARVDRLESWINSHIITGDLCFKRFKSRVPDAESRSTSPGQPAAVGSVPEGPADLDPQYLEDSEEE